MNARGYTLLEFVIVIIIVGIVAALVAPVLTTAVTAYDATSLDLELLARSRYAVERIGREIREMRRDPTDTAKYDIVGTPSATQLEFCKGDGSKVTVSASLANVTLTYVTYTTPPATCGGAGGVGTTTTSATLTDRVSSFGFLFCQQDGTTCDTGSATTEDTAGFVEISMTLASGTSSYANRLRVDLRNPQ